MSHTAGKYGPNLDQSGTFDTTGVNPGAHSHLVNVASVNDNDGSDKPEVLVADAEVAFQAAAESKSKAPRKRRAPAKTASTKTEKE